MDHGFAAAGSHMRSPASPAVRPNPSTLSSPALQCPPVALPWWEQPLPSSVSISSSHLVASDQPNTIVQGSGSPATPSSVQTLNNAGAATSSHTVPGSPITVVHRPSIEYQPSGSAMRLHGQSSQSRLLLQSLAEAEEAAQAAWSSNSVDFSDATGEGTVQEVVDTHDGTLASGSVMNGSSRDSVTSHALPRQAERQTSDLQSDPSQTLALDAFQPDVSASLDDNIAESFSGHHAFEWSRPAANASEDGPHGLLAVGLGQHGLPRLSDGGGYGSSGHGHPGGQHGEWLAAQQRDVANGGLSSTSTLQPFPPFGGSSDGSSRSLSMPVRGAKRTVDRDMELGGRSPDDRLLPSSHALMSSLVKSCGESKPGFEGRHGLQLDSGTGVNEAAPASPLEAAVRPLTPQQHHHQRSIYATADFDEPSSSPEDSASRDDSVNGIHHSKGSRGGYTHVEGGATSSGRSMHEGFAGNSFSRGGGEGVSSDGGGDGGRNSGSLISRQGVTWPDGYRLERPRHSAYRTATSGGGSAAAATAEDDANDDAASVALSVAATAKSVAATLGDTEDGGSQDGNVLDDGENGTGAASADHDGEDDDDDAVPDNTISTYDDTDDAVSLAATSIAAKSIAATYGYDTDEGSEDAGFGLLPLEEDPDEEDGEGDENDENDSGSSHGAASPPHMGSPGSGRYSNGSNQHTSPHDSGLPSTLHRRDGLLAGNASNVVPGLQDKGHRRTSDAVHGVGVRAFSDSGGQLSDDGSLLLSNSSSLTAVPRLRCRANSKAVNVLAVSASNHATTAGSSSSPASGLESRGASASASPTGSGQHGQAVVPSTIDPAASTSLLATATMLWSSHHEATAEQSTVHHSSERNSSEGGARAGSDSARSSSSSSGSGHRRGGSSRRMPIMDRLGLGRFTRSARNSGDGAGPKHSSAATAAATVVVDLPTVTISAHPQDAHGRFESDVQEGHAAVKAALLTATAQQEAGWANELAEMAVSGGAGMFATSALARAAASATTRAHAPLQHAGLMTNVHAAAQDGMVALDDAPCGIVGRSTAVPIGEALEPATPDTLTVVDATETSQPAPEVLKASPSPPLPHTAQMPENSELSFAMEGLVQAQADLVASLAGTSTDARPQSDPWYRTDAFQVSPAVAGLMDAINNAPAAEVLEFPPTSEAVVTIKSMDTSPLKQQPECPALHAVDDQQAESAPYPWFTGHPTLAGHVAQRPGFLAALHTKLVHAAEGAIEAVIHAASAEEQDGDLQPGMSPTAVRPAPAAEPWHSMTHTSDSGHAASATAQDNQAVVTAAVEAAAAQDAAMHSEELAEVSVASGADMFNTAAAFITSVVAPDKASSRLSSRHGSSAALAELDSHTQHVAAPDACATPSHLTNPAGSAAAGTTSSYTGGFKDSPLFGRVAAGAVVPHSSLTKEVHTVGPVAVLPPAPVPPASAPPPALAPHVPIPAISDGGAHHDEGASPHSSRLQQMEANDVQENLQQTPTTRSPTSAATTRPGTPHHPLPTSIAVISPGLPPSLNDQSAPPLLQAVPASHVSILPPYGTSAETSSAAPHPMSAATTAAEIHAQTGIVSAASGVSLTAPEGSGDSYGILLPPPEPHTRLVVGPPIVSAQSEGSSSLPTTPSHMDAPLTVVSGESGLVNVSMAAQARQHEESSQQQQPAQHEMTQHQSAAVLADGEPSARVRMQQLVAGVQALPPQQMVNVAVAMATATSNVYGSVPLPVMLQQLSQGADSSSHGAESANLWSQAQSVQEGLQHLHAAAGGIRQGGMPSTAAEWQKAAQQGLRAVDKLPPGMVPARLQQMQEGVAAVQQMQASFAAAASGGGRQGWQPQMLRNLTPPSQQQAGKDVSVPGGAASHLPLPIVQESQSSVHLNTPSRGPSSCGSEPAPVQQRLQQPGSNLFRHPSPQQQLMPLPHVLPGQRPPSHNAAGGGPPQPGQGYLMGGTHHRPPRAGMTGPGGVDGPDHGPPPPGFQGPAGGQWHGPPQQQQRHQQQQQQQHGMPARLQSMPPQPPQPWQQQQGLPPHPQRSASAQHQQRQPQQQQQQQYPGPPRPPYQGPAPPHMQPGPGQQLQQPNHQFQQTAPHGNTNGMPPSQQRPAHLQQQYSSGQAMHAARPADGVGPLHQPGPHPHMQGMPGRPTYPNNPPNGQPLMPPQQGQFPNSSGAHPSSGPFHSSMQHAPHHYQQRPGSLPNMGRPLTPEEQQEQLQQQRWHQQRQSRSVSLPAVTQGGPFPGLLYTDGRDNLGRPVVVLNTMGLPSKAQRDEALQYVLRLLQPVVEQEYVLVIVSIALGPKLGAVPAMWCLGAYRALAKPFRKNVKHVVVVQPSTWMKAVLSLSSPFISSKAEAKIKKVESLMEIGIATNREVNIDSLGQEFLKYIIIN